MYAVCVHVLVKEENRDQFIEATLETPGQPSRNQETCGSTLSSKSMIPTASSSTKSIARIGMAAHKETPHYAKWRDAVAPWMAEPRRGVKHLSLFPKSESSWHSEG